jgi:antitoxin HicB
MNYLMDNRYIVEEHTRTFAVVLAHEEEGGFTVRVPALPEIVTYGKDEAEALAAARDAIRLVLEDMTAQCEPIPPAPTPRIGRLPSRSQHDGAVASDDRQDAAHRSSPDGYRGQAEPLLLRKCQDMTMQLPKKRGDAMRYASAFHSAACAA